MPSKFNQMAQTDEEEVRKAAPFPVQKAKVVQVPDHPEDDGFHQVYVKLYYDQSRQRAPVLTGKQGDVSIPEEGEDVMVLFGASDKPLVIGSWYPTDDKYGEPNTDLVPDYEPGDRIIGNGDQQIHIKEDDIVASVPVNISNEGVEDAVANFLSGGTNITLTYDDANDTLTIDGYTDEKVQDAVGGILGSLLTYDDATPAITVNEGKISHDAIDQTTVSSGDHHARYTDSEAASAAKSALEPFSFTSGHTEWGTVTDEEIHRIDLQSGETLTVERVDVQFKGGGSSTSFSADVYDASAGTVLMSADAGSPTTVSATSGGGATILVRVTNGTGSTQVATITTDGHIE